jgi:hypothetical protein
MPCDMSANQRHSVPVSKTCCYGQVTAVKQQSNIAVLVLRQQFSLSAACVLHALALVCQALKGYVKAATASMQNITHMCMSHCTNPFAFSKRHGEGCTRMHYCTPKLHRWLFIQLRYIQRLNVLLGTVLQGMHKDTTERKVCMKW